VTQKLGQKSKIRPR